MRCLPVPQTQVFLGRMTSSQWKTMTISRYNKTQTFKAFSKASLQNTVHERRLSSTAVHFNATTKGERVGTAQQHSILLLLDNSLHLALHIQPRLFHNCQQNIDTATSLDTFRDL
ncbi:hypothetical protein L798_15810 [Zootermopsis nevadensis]|uniref:Uncharacterized protein n=1 Tax=Zootermopsis nevadensis TaxID=136037 RepID=A0A067QKV3_ZOONE|nr:hypothetical protein L798_15810 [Zootermopsis nevadensis]